MFNFAGIRRLTLITVLAAPVFACGTGMEGPEDPAFDPEESVATGSAPQISAEAQPNFDEALKSARLMFRQDRERFVARQATYEVTAEDGVVSIIAAHAADDVPNVKRVLSAPFVLETISIARDREFELGTGATGVGEGGRVIIDRNIAEEQFVNREDGTEQRWVFQHKPLGTGDLVVRVHVDGLKYVGQSDRGHHFIDEATQVGLLYGVAGWVDLTESYSGLDVRFDGAVGELVITVPHALVESSSYPAVLDPVVSAEFAATAPAIGPSAYPESTPDVASDGTNYLAVWTDSRDAVSQDIWGTFITAAQTLPNPTGQVIFSAGGDQRNPAVAYNGTEYLVVWEDLRRGTTLTDIYAIRVQPDGTVIGPEIAISTTGATGNPAVAALGNTFVVVWEERSGANSVINYRGVVGGGVGGAFALPGNQGRRPAIACAGANSNCLITFANGPVGTEDLHAIHVTLAGPAAASFTLSGTGMGRQLLPDVAHDGTRYMAVWQDFRSGTFDIYGARVSSTVAATLDNTGFVISAAASQQQAPTIAFDGTQYMVAWDDDRNSATLGRNIYGARVQTNRTVTDAAGIAIVPQTSTQDLPALTFGNGQYFIVWQDLRGGPPLNIRGTRITTAGTVPDRNGTTLANAANRQIAARIAFAGNGTYFVVWTDSRISGGADYDIIATRVRYDGLVLDPSAGRSIAVAANVQASPDISFDGTNMLIVWQDSRSGTNFDIYGARVAAANFALLDPNGIPISTAAQDQVTPVVEWNSGAGTYFVAWADRRDNATFNLWGARVTSAGVVSDPAGRLINSQPGDQTRPDIATNNVGWAVVWTDRRNGPNTDDVRAALLNGAGVVTANDLSISLAANVQDSPRIAWNTVEYFVVFRDTRTGLLNSNVFGNRLTAAGAILGGSGFALAASATLQESRPDVAYTGPGSTMFVVWSQTTAAGVQAEDLFGRQFTNTGAAVQAAFAISQQPGNEQQAAIGVINSTLTLVVYQRFDNTPNIVAERIRIRTVSFP